MTVSGETQRRNASAAVAAAALPVPDEVVGPTPRSKMRTSISCSLRIRTNSTLVWLGKSRWPQTGADGLPGFAGNRKFGVFDQNDEMRIADRHFNTNDLGAIESA